MFVLFVLPDWLILCLRVCSLVVDLLFVYG